MGRCLDAVLDQDYPPELVSVVYVDGGSHDGTVALARQRADADPRLVVVDGYGGVTLPKAMNVGFRQGTGQLVAKVDAHGWPEPDFLRRAAEAFVRCGPDVALVGGRPEQEGETAWGEAVAAARASRFGTGGSVYAGTATNGPVESVQCGVYRRTALQEVGGFDENMQFGEDDELSWRLREHGWSVELDTAVRFHYVARSTPRGLYRQYRGYGRAKVRVASAHPRQVRPWHLAPLLLVTGVGLLASIAPLDPRARRAGAVTMATYATAAVFVGARAGGPHPLRTAACFPVMHVAYGLGNVQGLADAVARRRRA
ncbi:MAG: glycosyl transferase family 2 [Frankiales bacterium]|nr:glycosyl transferase family 2 [Frankiales bacterium]